MTLVEDYLNLGHCIAMDNYSSSKLFIELVKRKTDAVGTVRLNRRGLPIAFRRTKPEKNERIVRYYKKTHQTNDIMMTQLRFRIALARSLLEYNLHDHLPNQVVRRGRPSIEPTPIR
ncbi:unnamed protein product, partial [Didymodactylos carnosus]